MGRPPLRPDVYSFRQDNYRSSPHTHFECPVEVQAQRPHQPEEVRRLTQEMEEEFLAKRKVVISGLPFDSSNDLVNGIIVMYFVCSAYNNTMRILRLDHWFLITARVSSQNGHYYTMYICMYTRNFSSSISDNFSLEGPISIIQTFFCS